MGPEARPPEPHNVLLAGQPPGPGRLDLVDQTCQGVTRGKGTEQRALVGTMVEHLTLGGERRDCLTAGRVAQCVRDAGAAHRGECRRRRHPRVVPDVQGSPQSVIWVAQRIVDHPVGVERGVVGEQRGTGDPALVELDDRVVQRQEKRFRQRTHVHSGCQPVRGSQGEHEREDTVIASQGT
jgi:hypothetical protein